MRSIRVVVDDETFEVLVFVKDACGLEWIDLLVGGCVYWWDLMGGAEGIHKRLDVAEGFIKKNKKND